MTHRPEHSGPHAVDRETDRGPWFRRIKGVYAIVYAVAVASCAVVSFAFGVLGDYAATKAGIKMAREDKLVAIEMKELIDQRTAQMLTNQQQQQAEVRSWMQQQGKIAFQMGSDIDTLKNQYANLNESRVDHEKRIEKLEKKKP